jgi:hypothetical protein
VYVILSDIETYKMVMDYNISENMYAMYRSSIHVTLSEHSHYVNMNLTCFTLQCHVSYVIMSIECQPILKQLIKHFNCVKIVFSLSFKIWN